MRIDCGQSLDQCPPHLLPRFAVAAGSGDFADQAVQADRVGRDRRVALVFDRLAVDQGEGAQRRHRLVETVIGEQRGQPLAEFLARLGEQE